MAVPPNRLAEPGLERFRGFDDFLQFRAHVFVMAGQPLFVAQQVEQTLVARCVVRQRPFGNAADGQLVDVGLVLRPAQRGDDAADRFVRAGGEIVAP